MLSGSMGVVRLGRCLSYTHVRVLYNHRLEVVYKKQMVLSNARRLQLSENKGTPGPLKRCFKRNYNRESFIR